MRFVIWLATEQPWAEAVSTAEHADSTGWDGIYLMDHFMPSSEPPGSDPRLEAWTSQAALAALTERTTLGILVSGNTYRHPAIVANMAATTDVISNGRLVLGLGAGWQRSEHEAYGIDLYEVPERLARFEEACEVVTRLLRDKRANFDGRYYVLKDAPCEPKGVQAHIPLLIGSAGEKVGLRITASHADIWNAWGHPDLIAHKSEVLARHCEKIGRDPSEIEHSAQVAVLMSKDKERLAEWRQRPMAAPHVIGTPTEIAGLFEAYAEVGLDEFVVYDRELGRDVAERQDTMDQLLEVAASFR